MTRIVLFWSFFWMKSFATALFAFVFLAYENINAQSIEGVVIDYDTKSTIAFANVYFNASVKGTTTDENGRFYLDIKGYEGQIIVVSCVGYSTELIKEYEPGKYHKVSLKSSISLLPELVIEPDDMSRKAKLRMFKREFLGNSANARSCVIKNENDLRLIYFKSTRTLEAFSHNPLIIINNRLGYKITYFLSSFSLCGQQLSYRGHSLFEKLERSDEKYKKKINKLRLSAYLGSRMHFIRYLWEGYYGSRNFKIWNGETGQNIAWSALLIVEGNNKYLDPTNNLEIEYQATTGTKKYHSSMIFESDQRMFFTGTGYFDPEVVSWSGAMAKLRIGDLLPYEYQPH